MRLSRVDRLTAPELVPTPVWLRILPPRKRPRCAVCGGWLLWLGRPKERNQWSCINCGEEWSTPYPPTQ
jgi:hypothetical protein